MSGCKPREATFKALVLFLFPSGVPDRVCWSIDHLLNVLLPPSLHLYAKVWLYQQQALGRTVSVSLLVFSGICSVITAMYHTSPGFAQMIPQHNTNIAVATRSQDKVWWTVAGRCNCGCYLMSRCSLACMCHSFHYIKRILETMFVHRISHGTMPLRNIFKVSEMHCLDLSMW